MVKRVAGELPPEVDAPVGDRYYWRSDFLVPYRPGTWYASIKMFSPWSFRTETKVNSENYKGYHLCDGVTMLLVRGDEYENIQPVWDWRKLPGITFKETSAPFPYGSSPRTEHNPNPFVGGVSDGKVGIAVLDLTKEDVRMEKSWFCFGDGLVCLGAGIECGSAEHVTTDLNQCLLHGPVQLLVDGAWADAPAGRTESSLLQAVRHDGIGYVFLSPARAILTAGPQRGSWAELRKEGVTPATVTMGVFNLWIDHGAHVKDAAYAYALLPRTDASAVARFAAQPAYRVLANTRALQAVEAPAEGLVGAVFQTGGQVAAGNGLHLASDGPGVVLVRRIPRGLALSVADPTQLRRTLSLTVNGRYTGSRHCRLDPSGQATVIDFELPQGAAAGSTVIESLAAIQP